MRGRSVAFFLVLCLMLSLIVPAAAVQAGGTAGESLRLFGADTTYDPDVPEQPDAPADGDEPARLVGMDVSEFQGVIDWDKVSEQIDFVIIRCGYGQDWPAQDDKQWLANVQACTERGIPFGVYLYSYAETDAQAEGEAQHVLRLLEGYTPTLPVYLDLEDPGTVAKLSSEDILRHTEIFCDAIAAAGYTPGVYSSYHWWTTRLTDPTYEKWERWLAYWYVDDPGFDRPYTAWQYSATGQIDGIEGDVDLDYWFGDFPIPGHVHDDSAELTQEPDCTNDGARVHTCTGCGRQYTERLAALGHDWDDGVVTVEPTKTQAGTRRYTCRRCGEVREETIPQKPTFTDVPADQWYADAVDWAVENSVTNGVTDTLFKPDNNCTRGQIVTFLWRANGCPEPTNTVNPFVDVPADAYYYKAVLWAVEKEITTGVDETHFKPDNICKRGQAVTFQWRAAGEPVPTNSANPFADVPKGQFYHDAVLWAVEKNITTGTTATTFKPDGTCTRGHIVTFLYRDLAK